MRTSLVLTLIGPDRPGLVEALAREIATHGGNWEQSRMAQLAGKFAGILRVSVPTARAAELVAALQAFEDKGLRTVVESAGAEPPPGLARWRLEVVGSDREGIVRDVSRALAERAVNVEELRTSCEDAPVGGGRLFRAAALLSAPASASVDEVRTRLEAIADDLMVEVSLDLDR